MSKRLKQILTVAAFIVVALVLVRIVSNPVSILDACIGLAIGSVVGVPLALFFFKKEAREIVEEVVKEAMTPAGPPKLDISKLMESLVQVSLDVRLGDKVDNDVISLVDQIVDELEKVVPQMAERYPGEVLTYELNRVCEEHLVKLLKEYLDINPDIRGEHKVSIIESLNGILEITKQASDILKRNEKSEFDVMATFLQSKYAK